jgi:arginine/lysine/ornithine decarboxylase
VAQVLTLPVAGRRSSKPSPVETEEQAATPLLEAVRAYDGAAFHCPGHKRGRGVSTDLRATVGDAVLASDVWLETGAYDRARRAAESLAAAAWGAHRAYVLGNGSTSGNHAFLLAHLRDGDTAVVSRTLHTSTLTGLVLTGARPVYVVPRVHPDLGTGLGIDAADVAAALTAHPGTRLLSVVSPSYTGVCSDTAAICAAAHAAGALAYVDEAWGPHLAFHPDLPAHAMAAGADGAVTSVHKLLPALSSGALLLAGPSVDGDRLDAVVRMTQTTSPLLPLLASVDAARRDLAVDGTRLVERAVMLAEAARRALSALPGLRVFGPDELGVRLDPLKLSVDVTGLGLTGHRAGALLRSACGIAPEGADLTSVYLVVGIGDDEATIASLTAGFRRLVPLAPRPGAAQVRRLRARAVRLGSLPAPGPAPLTPRQAFLGASRSVALRESVGEVCAELVTTYPPGIPVIAPGEVVTAEAVAYLAEVLAAGAHVHGTADPAVRTVRVAQR